MHVAEVCSLSLTRTEDVREAYTVSRLKDLPKLHKAAWKGDLTRVKHVTKDLKKGEINSLDKEKR